MGNKPGKVAFAGVALTWLLGAAFAALAGDDASPAALAATIAREQATTGVAPLTSVRVPGLDLERAYDVQAALVRGWPAGERIAGFKSAFNATASQQRFGLAAPAFAVLPASARRCADPGTPCVARLADYRQPVFEFEVALRVGKRITVAPGDRAALLRAIDAVLPAVELPELGMAAGPARGEDVVASNIGVRGYLLGQARPVTVLDGPLPMRFRDATGAVLATGDGAGAIDAALLLVTQALRHGYVLEPGQILLTGAVGGMVPGRAGEFVADGGALGEIRFGAR